VASRQLSRFRQLALGVGLIAGLQLILFTGPAPSDKPREEVQGPPLRLLGEETNGKDEEKAGVHRASRQAVEPETLGEGDPLTARLAQVATPKDSAESTGEVQDMGNPGQQDSSSSGSETPLQQEHKTTATSDQDYSKSHHGLILGGSGPGAISWRSVYSQEAVTYTVVSLSLFVPPR